LAIVLTLRHPRHTPDLLGRIPALAHHAFQAMLLGHLEQRLAVRKDLRGKTVGQANRLTRACRRACRRSSGNFRRSLPSRASRSKAHTCSSAGFAERRNRGQKSGIPAASLATISLVDDRRPGGELAQHAHQPREAPAEATPAAAVEFNGLADYVGLNAKAVEFDLVLPIIAGGHALGWDRATGLDVLAQDVAASLGLSNWRRALALVPRHKDDGCAAFA